MTQFFSHVLTQGTLWLCLLISAAWVPLAHADNASEWRRIAQEIQDKALRIAQESKDKALYEGTPQDMYLRAGSFSRNGDTDKATKIYQYLVDRHGSSPFAVKASDQLDAMGRTRAIEAAQYNAASRAACLSTQAQCIANCESRGMSYGYCLANRCEPC